nr:MAG TPA: hypothetical protein [Caudoviricetes sp.]
MLLIYIIYSINTYEKCQISYVFYIFSFNS